MEFNTNEVMANMLAAIKTVVGSDWNAVSEPASKMLEKHKGRLELLAKLRISGDISEEKFQSRLDDEKLILEAEMHAIIAVTKAIAQKAINAVIDVLNKAIIAAIKI